MDLFEIDGYFVRGDVTVQGQVGFGQQKERGHHAPTQTTGELRDSRVGGVCRRSRPPTNSMPRLEGIARVDYIQNKKNGGGLLGYTFADGRNGIGPDPNWRQEQGRQPHRA